MTKEALLRFTLASVAFWREFHCYLYLHSSDVEVQQSASLLVGSNVSLSSSRYALTEQIRTFPHYVSHFLFCRYSHLSSMICAPSTYTRSRLYLLP